MPRPHHPLPLLLACCLLLLLTPLYAFLIPSPALSMVGRKGPMTALSTNTPRYVCVNGN